MKHVQSSSLAFGPPLPPCTHMYTFGLQSPPYYNAYIKAYFQPLPPNTHTHTQTHYHHLTNNVFKYLSIKRYQALNRLKINTKQ